MSETNGNGTKRLMPSNSTTVGTVGGAGLAPLIVWLISLFGADVPPEAAASVGALVGNLIGYFFEGGRKGTA
jgi:hypothetical protein